MWRIFTKILRTGVVTEPPPRDAEVEALGIEVKRRIDRRFHGSIAIRQVDAGSCNGCELEIHATNNPYYDLERFGIHFVASPRHADLLLVTGPVSRNMETALRMTYEATPEPRRVVAIGDCAADGGVFGCSYACLGAVANVIPVDVVVHGCPPTPTDIIRGILAAIDDNGTSVIEKTPPGL